MTNDMKLSAKVSRMYRQMIVNMIETSEVIAVMATMEDPEFDEALRILEGAGGITSSIMTEAMSQVLTILHERQAKDMN